MTVEPSPMRFGERRVSIEVRTDSPETPVLPLILHIVGSQRPPFLLTVDGELTFRDPVEGDSREIAISTIERGKSGSTPEIRCTVPILRVVAVGVEESPHPEDDGVVLRVYRHRIELASTPDESFRGELLVIDPWIAGREIRMIAHGEVTPPLRTVPSRLVMRPDSKSEASFLVFARGPARGATITVEPAADNSPLRVELTGRDSDSHSTTFTVRWRGGRPVTEEVHDLKVRASPEVDELTIPVLIRLEDTP